MASLLEDIVDEQHKFIEACMDMLSELGQEQKKNADDLVDALGSFLASITESSGSDD